jgi:hypothetical protein
MWDTVRIAVGVAVLLLSQSVGWRVVAAAPPGAKGLFYSATEPAVEPPPDNRRGDAEPAMPRRPKPPAQAPTKRPQTKRSTAPWFGIAYWIEWARADTAPTRIADPARFVFQSGDRIRFHIQANRAGYLYVLNRDARGGTTVLFPSAGMAEHASRVQARAAYTVPPSGWLWFDDQPGEERVVLLLAPSPLTHLLDRAPHQPVLSPATASRLMAAVKRRGTKDLLVETDNTQGQEATYTGATLPAASGRPDKGGLVTVELRLQHQ